MTKQQIINYILDYDKKALSDRLEKLCQEDRITIGACYYVYNPYSFYSYKCISDLISKACQAKDYFRYFKRIDHTQYLVWKKMFDEDVARTEAFVQEQENLPFEETQKQQLIKKGEL